MILAGDVGGTKTNIGCFRVEENALTLVDEQSVPSARASGLEEIVKQFLAEHACRVTSACFGVAGPVEDGRCQTTNLPWVVDVLSLQRALGFDAVRLMNDLEATAYGLTALPASAFVSLNAGQAQSHGTMAVIAAGTGLGEAALVWDGRQYRAMASEGGHANFGPRTDLEIQLLQHLTRQFGHVSWERVLSGPGLVRLYQFLKETARAPEPSWLTEQLAQGDPAAAISEAALAGRDELCAKALDLFAALYGAEAGNVALKFLAAGGVYLGGGIAPKILKKLQDGAVLRAVTEKGRLSTLLSRMPVHVILEQRATLYGAAHYATQHL